MKIMNKQDRDFIHGESYVDGVMFNDDEFISLTIRKQDGSIKDKVVKRLSVIKKYKTLNHIIIKGLIRFVEGSINQVITEQYIKQLKRDKEGSIKHGVSYLSVFIIIIMGAILYFIFPTLLAFLIQNIINNTLLLNIIEVFLRLLFFLTTFVMLSFTKSIKKSSFYHGAEHKVIQCYLNGDKLTMENIRKHSIYDPSCGTSFIFILILVSIPFFALLNYYNILLRIAIMLLLTPLITGIAFDITTWIETSKSKIAKILGAPGSYLQRLNTKEPTPKHIEIALNSLKNLLNVKKIK